jgi:hypothetical protein
MNEEIKWSERVRSREEISSDISNFFPDEERNQQVKALCENFYIALRNNLRHITKKFGSTAYHINDNEDIFSDFIDGLKQIPDMTQEIAFSLTGFMSKKLAEEEVYHNDPVFTWINVLNKSHCTLLIKKKFGTDLKPQLY